MQTERSQSSKLSNERGLLNEGKRIAPGGPGLEPKWTRGAKDAVGTAYSTSSHVWYTLSGGSVTEVYYPTIDSPQIRDLQFLITDGASFFHDERRNLATHIDGISESALGFRVINSDVHGRYSIEKTVIGHPHQDCLLIHTKLHGDSILLSRHAALRPLRSSPGNCRLAQQR